MKIFNREFLGKALNALLVTISMAATFHLAIVALAAITKRNLSYLNPLDFLGLSVLLPQYRESTKVAAIGWLILIAVFVLVLYTRAHFKLYIAIIRETRVAQKLSSAAQKFKPTN